MSVSLLSPRLRVGKSTMGRILIVDDDESMREMLRRPSDGMGYAVSVAENGEEGLAMYARNPTAIFITDLLMPKKDGFHAIRKLRREFPTVKIIAMSGGLAHGSEAYLDLAELLGAQHILRKPFSRDELRKVLAAA